MRVAPFVFCLWFAAAGFAQSKSADLPKAHRAAERAGAAAAASAAAVEKPLCPVTGRPIDLKVWTELEGKRVYFADEAARAKFLDDPGAYAEAVRKQWELMRPLRQQVLCPVTGKPVDQRVSTLWNGERVYFATSEAKSAWEQEPRRYAEKLPECYTFQTVCACGYGDIRPEVSLNYQGRTLYFCCPGCREEFQRHPERMLKNVDERIEANQQRWEQQQKGEPRDAGTSPATQTP